ncbi:MAG: caspase family protein [Anaerolineae bacterium]|nr:caspase family protein [Anaerolineae bacterium]
MTVYDGGHALIVGVGGDLPNTTRDAEGLADILKDPSRCAYPPGHVRLLSGEGATRDAVLSALDTLAQTAEPESAAIVYFSGHGYRVASPTGEFFYMLPYGYDLRRLYQTAISGAEFTARLRAIPARKLLVLLDCCHAGGVGEETEAPGLELAKSPLPPEARDLLAEGSGRVLIASSRNNELSFAGRPYSAFTLALIEALSGTGAARQDGYVRVADLALHARQVVPGRTRDRQHPILHFEQADNFVLAYYAGGETQAKGVPFAGEPEIEPEPGAWTALDQRGQTVHGPQVNVAGTFEGPVTVTQSEKTDMRGAQGVVYKPAGPVTQEFGPHVEVDGGVSGQVGVGDGQTMIQIRDASADRDREQTPSSGHARQFCTSCGRRLRAGARFCSGCGEPVDRS